MADGFDADVEIPYWHVQWIVDKSSSSGAPYSSSRMFYSDCGKTYADAVTCMMDVAKIPNVKSVKLEVETYVKRRDGNGQVCRGGILRSKY